MYKMLILSLALIISLCHSKPIVILHGIMSSSSDIVDAVSWFEKETKNKVFNIEIGNGKLDSIDKPLSWQLSTFSSIIKSIPSLIGGFHFIGFSQGGLIGRGYAQTDNNPRIKSLITLGTPHQGVFFWTMPFIYESYYQESLSYSGYYKDPFMYTVYLENASYLPSINNEKVKETPNIDVDNFIMVWSPVDGVITPKESCKFEYYDVNTTRVVPLYESIQYTEDLIGLRELNNTGRLDIVESSCTHMKYKTPKCLEGLKVSLLKYLL